MVVVVRRFDLLASALAGRAVLVRAAPDGDGASTDGRVVFVTGDGPAHWRDQVILHASLIAAGSVDVEILDRLPRRQAVLRRYLSLEGRRALVDNPVAGPGVDRLIPNDGLVPPTSVEESLERAMGRDPVPDPPPWWGTIRPRTVRAAAGAGSTDRPVVAAAEEIKTDAPASAGDDREPPRARQFESPGGDGPIGRLLRRFVRAGGRTGDGLTGSTGSRRFQWATSRPSGGTEVLLRPGPTEAADHPGVAGDGMLYPEWDARLGRYRPGWCRVRVLDPPVGESGWAMPVPDPVLRRQLAPLGRTLQRRRRQPQGDEIDLDAALESWVSTRRGGMSSRNVYAELQHRRRELGVLVLLDASGSTDEPGPAGESVFDHQRSAVASLTETLHALGDRVGVYSFSSRGRQSVELLRVKGFDDPLGSAVFERLGALRPSGFTRLGAAVRHGTRLLAGGAGTPRRVLVVVSDGLPFDHGYEGAYAEADCRRALREARDRAVGALCLAVGSGRGGDELRRVFGATAYARVDDLTGLRRVAGPLVSAAMAPFSTQ